MRLVRRWWSKLGSKLSYDPRTVTTASIGWMPYVMMTHSIFHIHSENPIYLLQTAWQVKKQRKVYSKTNQKQDSKCEKWRKSILHNIREGSIWTCVYANKTSSRIQRNAGLLLIISWSDARKLVGHHVGSTRFNFKGHLLISSDLLSDGDIPLKRVSGGDYYNRYSICPTKM